MARGPSHGGKTNDPSSTRSHDLVFSNNTASPILLSASLIFLSFFDFRLASAQILPSSIQDILADTHNSLLAAHCLHQTEVDCSHLLHNIQTASRHTTAHWTSHKIKPARTLLASQNFSSNVSGKSDSSDYQIAHPITI
jgi:hypothetical protein